MKHKNHIIIINKHNWVGTSIYVNWFKNSNIKNWRMEPKNLFHFSKLEDAILFNLTWG